MSFVDSYHAFLVRRQRWIIVAYVLLFIISAAVGPSFLDNTKVFEVPAGHYFMMGDNRDNSQDSRTTQVGYVPFENIVGRAQMIFFSIAEGEHAWMFWRWPTAVRWNRIFKIVR